MDREDISEEIQKVPKKEVKKVSKDIAEKEEKISKAVSELPVEKDEIEIRKKKILKFIKNPRVWLSFCLIVALFLGIYIRSIPMHEKENTGNPGLWDIAKDDWTLGPDLDPWLFTRMAKNIVEDGQMPKIDKMRNVPLGFDTSKETRLLPYMIAWTYSISNLFYSGTTINFAASLFPVIMFALTILSFFLFVREVFVKKSRKSKIKANLISLVSTFFMIVIPTFLSRTVAGIPEKESAGFFFMFLSFYLFLKSWKSEKNIKSYIFGGLAGLSTALMGLIWGGVLFVYIAIGGSVFIAFLLNNVKKKDFISYSLWIWTAILVSILFTNRMNLSGMLTSTSSGSAFLVFFILACHFVLWKTKLSNYSKRINPKKIPQNIFSLLVSLLILVTGGVIFFGPGFILDKIKVIHQTIFKPVTGRWNTTVAENRQPYFTEWARSFGPYLKNIPVMFWLFLIGSIAFFKKTLKNIKKNHARWLTFSYILILIGMIFTRYSSNNLFDGESFISKAVYYLAIFFFLGLLFYFYYYCGEYKRKESAYKNIVYQDIFLLTLFLLGIFSARGSVRTIMVLGPIAPIFASFLLIESIYKFKNSKDESKRMFFGVVGVVILLLSLFTFWSYYQNVKYQAENHIPSTYNQQWQKAMQWVRENTAKDAVFAHWWDYGYWVQSIGNRATVLDGGNAISFWNYYMGRFVLTGETQKDALEFLYSHDANYLLIDPTDIGKYGAFSSIGSNENFDRFSWISIIHSYDKNIRETKDGVIRIYQSGTRIDEDIKYELNGSEIFLPSEQTALMGIIIETSEIEGKGINFKQPKAAFQYSGEQITLPLRYLEINGEFIDFGEGLEGTAKIIQRINVNSQQGVSINEMGSMIYISPRVMRGYLAQKYLLDDPFNNFPNFQLEYKEPNLITESLRNQGRNINEFAYYNDVLGPIKIWNITYTGNEEVKQKYLDTDSSKHLDWKL